MSNPLISIIIPVHNGEKHLSECLISIISQTYQEIEIIVVNDGSSDRSEKIIREYQKIDNRIRFINCKENHGVSAARNAALSAMKGQYGLFVDCDDVISPRLCEICCQLIEDADILFYSYTRNHTEIIQQNDNNISILKMNRRYAMEEFLKGHHGRQLFRGVCCNKFVSAKLLSLVRFKDGRKYGEDSLFTFELIKKAVKLAYVESKPLYYYRVEESSAIQRRMTKDFYGIIETYNEILCDQELKKTVNQDYTVYAYQERLLDIIDRIFSDFSNRPERVNELYFLSDLNQLSIKEILRCAFLGNKQKVFLLSFCISPMLFSILRKITRN